MCICMAMPGLDGYLCVCLYSSIQVYLSFLSLRLQDCLHGTSGLGGTKNEPPTREMNMRLQLLSNSYQYCYTYFTYPSVATSCYICLICLPIS